MLTEELQAVINEATQGHTPASRFLSAWHVYCHGIDDVLDGDIPAEHIKEFLIGLFVYAKDIYTCEFYRKNFEILSPIVDAVFNAYADSVMWQDAEVSNPAREKHADVIRSQGVDMVIIVAKLIGGYEHMRKISPKIRELSDKNQRS